MPLSDPQYTESTLISKNVTVSGRRTSVRLEPEMWLALNEISLRERCSIHDICTLVSLKKNENTSLTAAIRVFLMLYYRAATTEQGHIRAGHGNFESMLNRALNQNNEKVMNANKAMGASMDGAVYKDTDRYKNY